MTRAQAVAFGTHAHWTVEAEKLGAGRLVALVAVCASVVGGEQQIVPGRFAFLGMLPRKVLFHGNDERSFSERQRLFDGFGQPSAKRTFLSRSLVPGPRSVFLQAVDDDGDVVLDAAVQFEVVGESDQGAVDASPYETA